MMCLDEDEMFGCCFLGDASGALPSSLEARNWGASLDKLLLSSYGTALFRAFLQKEYAEENLDFVLKVERYRESGPKKRERDAWKIYRTYIAIGAPHELNLDILSRKVTSDFLSRLTMWPGDAASPAPPTSLVTLRQTFSN
jgi:hypothetical protein